MTSDFYHRFLMTFILNWMRRVQNCTVKTIPNHFFHNSAGPDWGWLAKWLGQGSANSASLPLVPLSVAAVQCLDQQ